MRHLNRKNRLGRKPNQARLILKNLATAILLYETVRTTEKRAKVVRALVDRIITIGKKDRADLAIRRLKTLTADANAVRKVLEVLVKRYSKRPSGFTRLKPIGMRLGDGARMVEISLVDLSAEANLKKSPKSAK